MNLQNPPLEIFLSRGGDVEECFVPPIDISELRAGVVVVPLIATGGPGELLHSALGILARGHNAGDEVVDGPPNDGVVEHANIDIDNADGVANTLEHWAYFIPE